MNTYILKHAGLAIFAVVVLGLVIWYMAINPAPTVYNRSTATTTPAVTGQATHITEDATYYTVDAQYPSTISFPLASNASAGANAVSVMKKWNEDVIAEFKKNGNFDNLSHDDVQMLRLDQRKYELMTEYEVRTGPKTVTYVYSNFEDTGGAHPNTFYRTFTFDVSTGKELSISDLFVPGSEYLSTLSTIARADLPGIEGDYTNPEFITDGTKPVVESFQNFYFEGSQLVIVFPPYQVGPYVLGVVKLPIERSRLAD
ncbi:MAG: DUF3298 domain-containing protein, partial [Patescibacteria group bacterium]